MNNKKYLPIYLVVIFIFNITTISTENKTSSECWACTPNTPHVLNCAGAGVIVIQSSDYGYKGGCPNGIAAGGGCGGVETNRCCKPGGPSMICFKSFNVRDREELETTCSNKSTCTFNSIRHDQPFNCFFRINNSFTLINYTCQTPETTTTAKSLSSTEKPIYTTSLNVKTTPATPIPAISSPTNNQGDTTLLDVKTSNRPSPSKETRSSDGKITSGEIGGIVVGVVAIVILLFIAGFLLYLRHEIIKLTRNRQLEQNHQQSTTRTVGVPYSETDFNGITAQSNIAASSSDVSTSYSQLNRLGSESIKYDDVILNNGQRNAITDNNSNGYYNQQYVNM